MGTEAGHINDNEEKQLMPGYGTIALGVVRNEASILGDITPRGRQRYVIYVPTACKDNFPAGTKVMFETQAVSLPGDFPPIEVAVKVQRFNYEEWLRKKKEEEQQQQKQLQDQE